MSPNDVGLRRGDEAVVLDEPAPASLNPVAALAQAASTPALKILILEDEPNDAALIQRELRKAGLDFIARRVDTRAGFIEALETFAPDILLADYKLPNFNGAEALAHVRHIHPEIPVVMVTGALGEEAAIDLLHAGAADYVLKSNLLRLSPAVERAISVEQGIRARKSAEAALRASNVLLQTTERIAHIGGFEWEIASGRIVWSEELYRMFGRSQGQFVPTRVNFIDCVHPDDREAVQEAIDASVTRDAPYDYEFRILRPDKTERIIHTRGEIVRDENGLPIRVTGTSDDITERIRTGRELAESELKLRAILEAAGEGILVADAETGKFVLANRAICDLLGYASAELIGLGVPDIHPPSALASSIQHFARIGAGESRVTVELPVRRKDGSVFAASITASPMILGGRLYAVGIFTDITERKEDERTLRRLNRTLRTLSRGNEALVRGASEPELLNEMCWVIVETGGYRMAWVGVPQQDAAKTVTPVAWAGIGAEFFEDPPLHSWAGESEGGCLCGRALNSGQPQTSQDLLNDPAMTLWRARFARYGISAAATFPLRNSTGGFAVLAIYAAEADAFDTDELKLLQELADDLAFGIRGLREHTAREALDKRWRVSLEATIGAIASTVEMRDPYTAGHQQRVARLAVAIARELHLPEEQIEGLYLAGIVHDVGKIDIPAEILSKPGRLSKLQYQLIQAHAEAGYDILKGIDFPWPIAEMVRQHHERIDGSGYPRGLKAEAILPEAKILAVADVVESMMSHRTYLTSLGIEAALADIEEDKGRLYDPAAVAACTALFRENGFTFE